MSLIDIKEAFPRDGYALLNVNGELRQVPIGFLSGPAYISKKKIKEYLWNIWYGAIDYEYADLYFKEHAVPLPGACSSIRSGNFHGRNYDWLYDESAEFVVHTPAIADRYASVGIASSVPDLTDIFVSSGEYSDMYKIIPFMIVDGINEKGLVVNVNVVPQDYGVTSQTIPFSTPEEKICALEIPRYILDHFATAETAAEYIRDHVAIYMPETARKMGFELHWMISDATSTLCLEIIEDEVNIVDISEAPYMTNFHLTGIVPYDDGTVGTPANGNAVEENNITEHGQGLERYNLIVDNYASLINLSDMKDILTSLNYTNSYYDGTNPYWYTELTGMHSTGDLKVNSPVEDYIPIVERSQEIFEHRSRKKSSPYFGTWHTVHSSIYDLNAKKLYLATQQEDEWLEFNL